MTTLSQQLYEICNRESPFAFFSYAGERRRLIKDISTLLNKKNWENDSYLIAALAPILKVERVEIAHNYSGTEFKKFYATLWDILFLSIAQDETPLSYNAMLTLGNEETSHTITIIGAMCKLMEARLFTHEILKRLYEIEKESPLEEWSLLDKIPTDQLTQDRLHHILNREAIEEPTPLFSCAN